MSDQQTRRNNALDVMRTLSGGAYDPQRAVTAMLRRHGSLGTFGVDHVLGNLWSRPQLSRRDRSLIVVAFLASIGSTAELEAHVHGAVSHGLTRAEVEEIINQVAGYAGFPMAMQATRIVDAVWCKMDDVERLPAKPEAAAKDDPQRWADATDVLGTLFAGRASSDPEQARNGVVGALGGVGEFAFDFAFGELWARDELSRRDRSLATIAILAILKCTDELKIHLRGALNHGVTREEVEEVMIQLTVYGGFPRAVEGFKTAQAIFARIDKS
ncbi:MAG: carboxymuconolactone decarboxylase family protein [Gammaproteobacteria bacterium]|nr:carboxymuconolactone decarboxylase family protein [Gammaproteobacteria bacterium]